eukprot:7720925-Ditylum_brightwellii.AAC.1
MPTNLTQPRNNNEDCIVQYIREHLGRPPHRDRLFCTWVSNSRHFHHDDLSTHHDSLKGWKMPSNPRNIRSV